MARRPPFCYSDTVELYNSANLQLPDAENAIGEALNLQIEGNQQFISNWRRLFLVPTPVSFSVSTAPSTAIVRYSFSLKNDFFLAAIVALAAVLVGVNNYKTATYLLAAASVLVGVAVASIQNSFIRNTIADVICLPTFEGEAQVQHNQMVWMSNPDVCPACGTPRTTDSTEICQNCGIKLPSRQTTKNLNDKFTSQKNC